MGPGYRSIVAFVENTSNRKSRVDLDEGHTAPRN